VKAIRLESEIAVAHHWGISPQTVWLWRKALGLGATTQGTSRLRGNYFAEPWAERTREKVWSKARDPERRAKIAGAKVDRPRPRHIIEAMRQGRLGKRPTEEARRKMSEAQRRRGTWPLAAGRPWTAEEEALLGAMADGVAGLGGPQQLRDMLDRLGGHGSRNSRKKLAPLPRPSRLKK
jgi:hypothetical protein